MLNMGCLISTGCGSGIVGAAGLGASAIGGGVNGCISAAWGIDSGAELTPDVDYSHFDRCIPKFRMFDSTPLGMFE